MADGFQLIDLTSNIAFSFQYFPEKVKLRHRANWEPQETTIGTKPLFYGSGEPMNISVEEAWLDNTDTGRSLKPDLDDLRILKDEVENTGAPPPLLAIWGDHKERCVVQELTIEESMFNEEGNPTRAKITLELIELQPEGESTSVKTGT